MLTETVVRRHGLGVTVMSNALLCDCKFASETVVVVTQLLPNEGNSRMMRPLRNKLLYDSHAYKVSFDMRFTLVALT